MERNRGPLSSVKWLSAARKLGAIGFVYTSLRGLKRSDEISSEAQRERERGCVPFFGKRAILTFP